MQIMRFDVVIPVFNEALVLRQFHDSLSVALSNCPYHFRIIYIDDGSTDNTGVILSSLSATDSRVSTLHLSRNFGHQAALSAGLDLFDADALIMMDGDGEHPPELIPEMIRLFECGYDIIQTQRTPRPGAPMSGKALTGSLYYRLINRVGETRILPGGADFRLLSRTAALALRQLHEYHRFYRGMVPWLGFRTVVLPFTPSARIAGRSKYSLRKMLHLAADGLFSFSLAPLRFGLFMGMLFLLLAAAEITYVLSFWLRGDTSSLVPGWSSLMIILTVSSAFNMLLQGILGIYIGMIFQEAKRRPIYIARNSSAAAGTPDDPTLVKRAGADNAP